MHLVLLKHLLHILSFGRNMHKGIIFLIIFVTNEIFEALFTETKLY